jgi:hypothetical protein
MTDVNIDTVLQPLQGMLNTLQGSQAARLKYGEELGKKVQEVETALGLLKEITTGVNKLKDDIKDGQDAISAAKASGEKKVADEIARVKEEAKKDAVEAAKQAGENVTAAKREAIDKIQPLVDAIAAQKENIEGAIDDLNNVGFSDSMDKVVKAINELNKIFNTDGPKPPPHGPKGTKPFSFADAGSAMTTKKGQDALSKQRFEETRRNFEGGRRRTRRRRSGGFRYGVPKSALPRTLRSVLSLKTKSTRRKSPKKRKGKKSRKRKRKRKRRR